MLKLVKLEAVKTYKTAENAKKAVETKFANTDFEVFGHDFRYFITQSEDGRFFPVFMGQECIQAGVHFHFNVVG